MLQTSPWALEETIYRKITNNACQGPALISFLYSRYQDITVSAKTNCFYAVVSNHIFSPCSLSCVRFHMRMFFTGLKLFHEKIGQMEFPISFVSFSNIPCTISQW